MKLAACYTIFNNLELLDQSISQVSKYVDVIVIGYQRKGWNGRESTEIIPFMKTLLAKHYADKLVFTCYNVTDKLNPKNNEIRKHNQMLNVAKDYDCTHFFISACDHFYKPSEFKRAKELDIEYDVTFTKMYTYYKFPIWQLDPIEAYLMPFIMKIYPNTSFIKAANYPERIDPALKVNTCGNYYTFSQDEIMMHHFSMVRIDVAEKFQDSASRFRWTESKAKEYLNEYENYDLWENEGIKYFGGRKVKIVQNFFGIK